MAADDDLPFGEEVPEDTKFWDMPVGVPVNSRGEPLIPELRHRDPTHNESVLLSGVPIAMASSNVDEIWWKWGSASEGYNPRLFVRFLDGSLYVYHSADLETARGMVETMSPGRYVWNVLRTLYPVPDAKGSGPGQYERLIQGTRKGRRRQVVRLVDEHPKRGRKWWQFWRKK